ncbi:MULTISPECIES: hypothetical protein [Haloferax]|uniref:CARDB domain-containing protein n=1 Tax=Haloferax marinum TaxID=2666143 RepID=A0A6A8G6K4_9EURY|nr:MULTISPECIES: hypothetical protein [Haloferax]KAB1197158.1 hypothetical protein Hfx1150_06350 [Haloferax sp. CBA1150]MRW96192.1 hypothetical protein [Haloferax marinum]
MRRNVEILLVICLTLLVVTAPVTAVTTVGRVDGAESGVGAGQKGALEAETQVDAVSSVDASILNFNQDSGQYAPGETVTAGVEVRNTGDSTHTFFVGYSVKGPNGEWYDNDGGTGQTVTLDPGERTWITVSWTVEAGAPAGYYDAVTSVWKESDPDNLYTRLDSEERTSSFEVIEPSVDAQITTFDVDAGDYTENENVDATVRIENTGNVEHTYFVGYSARGPDGQWRDNGGETGRTVTLASGEARSVSVDWDVESGTPEGYYDAKASVWKESDRDNLYTRLDTAGDSNAFEVVEPTDVDAEIVGTSVDSGSYVEGDTVDATARIENTGNVEHTYFVGYSVRGPDGRWYDNDGQTGGTVRLGPGESTYVALNWDVESGAPVGTYDTKVSVWKESDRDNLYTRLDTQGDGSAFEVADSVSVDARVSTLDVDTGEYRDGDSVRATARIENTGNVEHTYFVGYSVLGPNGEWRDNDGSTGGTVRLGPGESTDVTLNWDVENDAPAGAYDAKVSVWKESDRDNLYTRLDTESESSAFSVADTTTVDARITNFDVDSGEVTSSDRIEATVRVENNGDVEHTYFVGVSVQGPGGQWRDNDGETGTTVTLGPGESRSVSTEWRVEDDAPAGAYDAKVSVWEESDRDNLYTRLDTETDYDVFEVGSQTRADARITGIEQERDRLEPGASATVTATVENTGDVEHTFFVGYSVLGPNGRWYDNDGTTGKTVTLGPGDSTAVTLSWDVRETAPSGEYSTKVSLWKESDRDSLHTRLDSERRDESFVVVDPTAVGAEVVEFVPPSGEFAAGDAVEATATIENTGDVEHTFLVGYSVRGPEGALWDNGGQTGKPVTLGPGETATISLTWDVEEDAPSGPYDAVVAVWEERDRDTLTTKVDAREQDEAFTLVRQTPTTTGGGVETYEVHVRSDDGPVEGVTVDLFGPSRLTAQTNTNGVAVFESLREGEYTVYVTGRQLADGRSKEVSISPNRARLQTTVLASVTEKQERASLEGNVDYSFRYDPQWDVDVEVKIYTQYDSATADVSEDGSFEFDETFAPDKRYTMHVLLDGESVSYEQFRLNPGPNYRQVPMVLDAYEYDRFSSQQAPSSVIEQFRELGSPTKSARDNIFGEETSLPQANEYCANTHTTADTECLAYARHTDPHFDIMLSASSAGFYEALQDTLNVVKNTPQAILAMVRLLNPFELGKQVAQTTIFLIENPDIVSKIAKNAPKAIHDKQRQYNTHPRGTEKSKVYSSAWWGGYIVYQVAEIAVLRGGGKAVKATKYGTKASTIAGEAKSMLKIDAGRELIVQHITRKWRARNGDGTTTTALSSDLAKAMDDDSTALEGDWGPDKKDDDLGPDPDGSAKFTSALTFNEKYVFAHLMVKEGVDPGRIQQFKRLAGADGAAFTKRAIDEGDPETLRRLFTIDKTGADTNFDTWRVQVARRLATTDSDAYPDLKLYIDRTYRVSDHPKIKGADRSDSNDPSMFEAVDESQNDHTRFTKAAAEADTALRYSERDDVTYVELNPRKFDDSKKDVDVRIKTDDGSEIYAETKHLTADNLLTIRDNVVNINGKFTANTRASGADATIPRSAERVGEIYIDSKELSRSEVLDTISSTVEAADDVGITSVRVYFRRDGQSPFSDREPVVGKYDTADGEFEWEQRSSSRSISSPDRLGVQMVAEVAPLQTTGTHAVA